MSLNSKQLNSFEESVERCETALIVCHEFPDIDAIGSCLALKEQLEKQGKTAKIWVHQKIESSLEFLPNCNQIDKKYPSQYLYDTIYVLDCSFLSRVAQYQKLKADPDSIHIVNIDHHPDNGNFGQTNIVTHLSSVGETLATLFYDLGWEITPTMANCLYAAISFDTGRFAFSNTTEKTLHIAAKLVKDGASPYFVSQAMDENKSIEDFQVIKVALDNLTMDPELKLGYTIIPKNAPKSSIVIIDVIRQLKECQICVVFKEVNSNLVKINLRSKTDFDVSVFAQKFQGGGHKKASGIKLSMGINQAKEAVLSQLEKDLKAFG